MKGDPAGLLLLPVTIALLNSRDNRAATAASFLHKFSSYSDSAIAATLQNSSTGTLQHLLQVIQLSCKHDNWEYSAIAASVIILRLTRTTKGLQLLLQHDLEPVLQQAFQQRWTATNLAGRWFPDLHSLDLLDAVDNICSSDQCNKTLAPHAQLLIAAAKNTAGACGWQRHYCTAMKALAAICRSGPDGILCVAPHAGELAGLLLQDSVAAAAEAGDDHGEHDVHDAFGAGLVIINHVLTSDEEVEAPAYYRMVQVLVAAVQQPRAQPWGPLATAALADVLQTPGGTVALATPSRVQILLDALAACVKYNLLEQIQHIKACLASTIQAAFKQSDYKAKMEARACLRPVMDLVTRTIAMGADMQRAAAASERANGMSVVCEMVVKRCLLPLANSRHGMWALVVCCASAMPLCKQGMEYHSISTMLDKILAARSSLEHDQACVHSAMLAAGVAFAQHRESVYAEQLVVLAELNSSMQEALLHLRESSSDTCKSRSAQ